MKNRLLKRAAALLVTFSLLLNMGIAALATESSAIANVYHKETYSIGPGVTYEKIRAFDSTGAKQEAKLLTLAPGNNVVPEVAYGTKLYGRSRLTTIASRLETDGKMVLGGVNGDFFSLQTGLPLGAVILDGRIAVSDAGYSAMGFLPDGTAFIGKPDLSFTLKAPSADDPFRQTEIKIDHVNKLQTVYGLYLYTYDFSANTRSTQPGAEVVLKVEGELRVGQSLQGEVLTVANGVFATPIAENTMVLSASGAEPASRLAALKEGDIVTIESPSADPRWAQVQTALGGGEMLIENGLAVTNTSTEIHPRTALGLKADGSVVLFEIDGRQSGYSRGMTLTALTQHLLSLGCVSAINMDGGGSSTMIVRFPAADKAVMVNKSSDGTERSVANGLFLINQNEKTGIPKTLHFTQNSPLVYKGSSLTMSVYATDTAWYPVDLPAPPVYSTTAGTIAADLFTAPAAAAEITVTATAGAASGSNKIKVVDSLDSFAVSGTLEVVPSEPTQLSATGYKWGIPVAIDPSNFTWTVEGDIGGVDEKGLYTPSAVVGHTGKITVASKDQPTLSPQVIQVTVGKKPAILADFEGGVSSYAASGFGGGWGEVKALSGMDAMLGDQSAQLNYNFQYASIGSGIALSPSGIVAIGSKPKAIELWVKGDGSDNRLSCELTDSLNNTVIVDLKDSQGNSSLAFTDWRKMSAEISGEINYPLSFKGIFLQYAGSEQYREGSIGLDHICASYGGDYDDLTPPKITVTSPAADSPIEEGAVVTVAAQISDGVTGSGIDKSKVKLFINGKQVSHELDDGGKLGFTISDTTLTQAGLNRVSIEATDRYGNTSRAGTSFVLPNGQPSLNFADIDGHWAQSVINYIADKSIIVGEVEGDKRSFYPERNLSRAEFAVILAKFKGMDTTEYDGVTLPFADADKIDEWALPAAKMCFAQGWINGNVQLDGSVNFDGKKPITRQEVITILGKMLDKQRQSDAALAFSDADKIAFWARPYVEKVVNFGLIGGYPDGTLLPANTIKRGEIAKIIFSLY